MTKIGVVIPTRGDRGIFLEQARRLLLRQTMLPQMIEIVNYTPESNDVDLTTRFRRGFEKLFAAGCECILAWEDDDWYHETYIERMVSGWKAAGRPALYGIGNTLYYNIRTQRYLEIPTMNRASMMSTLVGPEVLKLDWPASNYPFLDFHLWKQVSNPKAIMKPERWLAVGIKHGTGLCGGAGHDPQWSRYNKQDARFNFLRAIIGSEADFYSTVIERMGFNYSEKRWSVEKPFVSIITRKYKRPAGFSRNQESIALQTDQRIQQIFIEDPVGRGMLAANGAFRFVKSMVLGSWVYLLDDDDFLVNPEFVSRIREIALEHNPDVILFRMTIKTGSWNNHYPSPVCWEKREPLRAHIGGSCFIVKREIYNRFISLFHQPSFGDFCFIDAVYKSGAKFYWQDELMAETGKVSRGAAE